MAEQVELPPVNENLVIGRSSRRHPQPLLRTSGGFRCWGRRKVVANRLDKHRLWSKSGRNPDQVIDEAPLDLCSFKYQGTGFSRRNFCFVALFALKIPSPSTKGLLPCYRLKHETLIPYITQTRYAKPGGV